MALGGGAGVREEAAATADLLWKMATPATVVGADFGALRRVQPSWRLNGAWPEPDEGACLVGASLASRAGLGPGGEALVWTGGSERGAAVLRVAGVVVTGESEDEQVFVPLKVLQRATGLAGRVSLAALSIDGSTEAVESAALRIVAALPGSSAHPLRQIAAAQGALLGKLQRMMLLLTAVVLLLSALCLSTTLMSSVIAREGEIGLMRSIGAGDGEILKMFFGEVSLLGLFGGLLGLALGAGATRLIGQQLFETAIEPRWGVIPVVLASCVVLCLISVLLPLRTALAVAPATALRGE